MKPTRAHGQLRNRNTSCHHGAVTLPDPPPQPRKRGGARPQCSGLSHVHGVPSTNKEGLTERNQTQTARPYKTPGNQGDASGKEPACKCRRLRDPGLIPGSERSPREGNGNPLQYSCLEKTMDRGDWQAIVHGVAKSQTQLKQLSTHS